MSEKVDLIIGAYSLLRISGMTTQASDSELELALGRLETMAAEIQGRNMNTGYFFETDPDPNTLHNLDRKYWHSYEVLLAFRLAPDFGKPSQPLITAAAGAASFLASSTVLVRQVTPPARMPIGSGNTKQRVRWHKFYAAIPKAPLSAESISINIDDVNDYREHYKSYLLEGEDISSFTIEADTGLTINSSSIDSSDILYQIKADEVGVFHVKIIITTTDSRINTRLIYFTVIDTDVIE